MTITSIKARDREHLNQLIQDCIALGGTRCDLNHIDVTAVTNMNRLFAQSKFNGDISKWNVSGVTNMDAMFSGSSFNGDISQWDVSNVKDMSSMFAESQFNGDLSRWDTSNVQYMIMMFFRSPFNGDISNWDTSSCTNMIFMFQHSAFNQDISGWNTSKVEFFQKMFDNTPFHHQLSSWEISSKAAITGMVSIDYPFEWLPPTVQFRYEEVFQRKQWIECCSGQSIGIAHVVNTFSYKRCPKHLDPMFFKFVKTQQQLCEALGLSREDMVLHIHQQYQASLTKNTLVLPEAVDFAVGLS